MKIVAMIPARGGSKGLNNKNLRQVGGKPLILYTIEAALSSKRLSRIIVSTDSLEIIDLAEKNNIEAPFIRPDDLSGDRTCMIDVMAHCVDWLKGNEDYNTDLLVTIYPTSPFRTGLQIDQAIEVFQNSDADCLVSVSKQNYHPYWTLNIDDNKKISHYFGKDHIYYRRQDMPDTYVQNGAIYIVPPGKIVELDKRSMTDNTIAFIMNGKSSINIDDEMDLILANSLENTDLLDRINTDI